MRPLYMLSMRHPPQIKGHIQIESKGLEKDISFKWIIKESRSSNTHKINPDKINTLIN